MSIFKNIFFSIILFTILCSQNAYSEVVNKIQITGNKRISPETIAIFGDVLAGKDYQESDINLLIKKLYDTQFFSNISVDLKNNILSIFVTENPIINQIVFNGENAKKYKEKITELLVNKEKNSYVTGNIKSDINLIKSFYRESGFYFVKIDAEVQELSENKVNIVFSIDKGDKAKIAKIYFLGDKKIRDKKLRDIITSQESQFWKFISRNVYLNKQRIELDKRLLTSYYKNKGFYEVEVTSSNVEYSEAEGFVLTFSINAGKRYKFKKIFANVSDSLDKNAFLSLEREFDNLIGKYYSLRKLNDVLSKIDKLSEQKELQFINHNVLETLDENGVQVQINIFEGDKFIIERINIVGNAVTNDSVIRSELLVDEGDPYSTLLVNKSINRIKGRGLFGSVVQETSSGSSNDLKILNITVEEKATGEIIAGAGIGTDGTSFSVGVKENNWLGRGVSLQSALLLTQEKISGNIAVTNPNYNYSNNSVSASLDVSATDRTAASGFKSSRTGFKIGTGFEQYENIFISPGLSASWEDIEAESSASESIKKMEGNYFNSDFTYGITLDKRNQTFEPTEGYVTRFNQSLPIIQDSSSIMNNINITTYHDFSDDLIGSLKFYAKSINGVDDNVRLTRRLYLPRKRIRGFESRKVGPKDGIDWIGGNYATAVTAEAKLPNLLPETYRTDISVFMDSANLWGVDYNEGLSDTNRIRSSVGVSANVFTTIGPLSFTLAVPVSKASTDVTETFNFNLGTSF